MYAYPEPSCRYDSHRDAILRSGETHQAGGDGGVTPGQRPSDELDPFQYFSTACYSGYNDGAKVQPASSMVSFLADGHQNHCCGGAKSAVSMEVAALL